MTNWQSEFHPLQISAWRRMTSEEKWALARSAQRMVMEAARRRIARQNPAWDGKMVQTELSRFLIRART